MHTVGVQITCKWTTRSLKIHQLWIIISMFDSLSQFHPLCFFSSVSAFYVHSVHHLHLVTPNWQTAVSHPSLSAAREQTVCYSLHWACRKKRHEKLTRSQQISKMACRCFHESNIYGEIAIQVYKVVCGLVCLCLWCPPSKLSLSVFLPLPPPQI